MRTYPGNGPTFTNPKVLMGLGSFIPSERPA